MACCRVFLTSARKMRVLRRGATPEFGRAVSTHGKEYSELGVALATVEEM